MTRIDFHSNVQDPLEYACRLTRKARAADCRIVLLVSDRVQLDLLDAALWDFSESDFLPHVAAQDRLADRTPIILADNDGLDLPHHQVLINLTSAVPAHFARFERLVEIVAQADAQKQAARDRYLFYKQRGYALTHFDAEKP